MIEPKVIDPETIRKYATKCRGCSADIIFLKTKSGKNIPVNVDSIKTDEVVFDPRTMKSHFATCPMADYYRRKP